MARTATPIALVLVLVCSACTENDASGPSTGAPAAGAGGHGGMVDPMLNAGGSGGAPSQQAGTSGSRGSAGVGGSQLTAGSDANAPDAAAPLDASADGATEPEPVICPTPALPAGDHEGNVQFEGRERSYVLHVPANYMGSQAVPVVFDFHGYGSSGAGQMGASGFRELSEEHGFVAVYPNGVGGSWHVNGCCGQAATEMLDEVGAVRAVLADVITQICVDSRRVYASGISQGGGMAHHVGCLAADLFAAVAPVSSDLRTEPCTPARSISELSFRGTADGLSAYEGGPVGPVGMQYQSIGAAQTLERWRMIDQCTGTPETTLELCETYSQCEAGVEVGLCTLPGAGHVLYTNPSNFDVAHAAWAMFERHPL